MCVWLLVDICRIFTISDNNSNIDNSNSICSPPQKKRRYNNSVKSCTYNFTTNAPTTRIETKKKNSSSCEIIRKTVGNICSITAKKRSRKSKRKGNKNNNKNISQNKVSNHYNVIIKNGNNKNRKVTNRLCDEIFGSINLCMGIFDFLSIKETIMWRRMNKYFNKQFNFCYSLENNQLFFNYQFSHIKQMIENEFCHFKTLAYWFAQVLSFRNDECIEKSTSVRIKSNISNDDLHSTLHTLPVNSKHLFEIDRYFAPPEEEKENVKNCGVFKELYHQLQFIQEKGKEKDFVNSGVIDYLLLGWHFNILPIKRKFEQLINKNRTFRRDVCFEPFTQKFKAKIGHFVFEGCGVLPPTFTFTQPVSGFLGFFMHTSLKGDFSIYENYIKDECENDNVFKMISDCGIAMDGLFLLMCLFLRSDLIAKFAKHNKECGLCASCEDALCCLLDPNYLLEYEKNMTKAGCPLSKENKFEMDLINNSRYHPLKRMKLIKKLCFSSCFMYSLVITAHSHFYGGLRRLVHHIMDSFEYFQKSWHLMEYDDIKNDVKLQRQMYSDLKVMIQCMFGFGECFVNSTYDDETKGYEPNNLFKQMVHGNADNYNVKLNDKDAFVDIVCPENSKQVESLYNAIKQRMSDDDLLNDLRHCTGDRHYQELVEKHGWGDCGGPLIFSMKYDNPYLYFYNMWKIDCDYDK